MRSASRALQTNCARQTRTHVPTCHQRFAHTRTTGPVHARCIHSTRPLSHPSPPPRSRDRGPKSNEDTQTDFDALDVLRNTAAPATSIDACTEDGFALNNQTRISGSGVLLVGGEAFRWRPWDRSGSEGDEGSSTGRVFNKKGQWEVPQGAWGVLELVFPKPGKFFSREPVTRIDN